MLATLTPAPSASMIGSSSGCSVAVIALLAARPQFLSAHASHDDAPTVAALAEVGRRLREGEDIDATLADSLGFECRDTSSIASVLGPVPCTAIAALMMRVRFEVEVACPLFRRTPCLGGEGLHTSLRLLELLSMQALDALGHSCQPVDRSGLPALLRLLSHELCLPLDASSGRKRPRTAAHAGDTVSLAGAPFRASPASGVKLRNLIRALFDPATGSASRVMDDAEHELHELSNDQRSVFDAVAVSLKFALTPGIAILAKRHHLVTQNATVDALAHPSKQGLLSPSVTGSVRHFYGPQIRDCIDFEHMQDADVSAQASWG